MADNLNAERGPAAAGYPALATKEVSAGVHVIKVLPVNEAGAADAAGETTVTPAAVTLVASTAKTLIAANTARKRVVIINPLGTPLYVRKATLAASPATAAAGGYDFAIAAGSQWTSDLNEYAGAYNVICATAGDVGVSESV